MIFDYILKIINMMKDNNTKEQEISFNELPNFNYNFVEEIMDQVYETDFKISYADLEQKYFIITKK